MQDIQQYGQIIAQFPLLEHEEVVELSRLTRLGDPDAREKLILCNLRLVVKIALDFEGLCPSMPLEDLISEGNIGLMTAAERFDGSLGYRFSTYARWWIMQRIIRGISNQGRIIRLPIHLQARLGKMRRLVAGGASEEEVATEMGISTEKMESIRDVGQTTVSLDTPIGEDDDQSLQDVIAAEEPDGTSTLVMEQLGLNGRLSGFVGELDRNARLIMTMRFGLNGATPKTLDDIAVIVGLTRERIRQIERKSLLKLKTRIGVQT